MRARPAALVLLLAALALPACSIGGDDEVDITAPPASAGAQPGGELKVGIVRPASIDPQLLDPSDGAGNLVVRTMCDPLVGTDPDGRDLAPSIVKTWRVLDGGKSVQLEIYKGLKYNDGSTLTARDVAETFYRLIKPSTVSPSARIVRRIAGWQELQDDKNDYIAGVAAISGDTIQIQLDRADAQWVHALTLPLAVPVPAEKAEAASFTANPVCVGPYKLATPYTGSEKEIRLVRTPDYEGLRPGLTRAGAGWADTVTFTIFPTRAAALKALRSGAVDAAQVSAQDVGKPGGPKVLSVPTGRLEYVGLPTAEPFNDPLVKAALSTAIDRTALNEKVFRGTRVPAYNLLPVTLPEDLMPEDKARTCAIPPAGDVALAKRILASRNIDLSKTTVPFYYNDEFDNEAMVTELARQWKAAFGLDVKLRKLTFDALLARGGGPGGFDGLFRMTAIAEFPDIAEFLLPLLTREALGTTNLTGFDGELITNRLEADAMTVVDKAEQRNEYFGIVASMCGVPIVPIAWYQSHLAVGADVVIAGNGGVDTLAGVPELRELAVG